MTHSHIRKLAACFLMSFVLLCYQNCSPSHTVGTESDAFFSASCGPEENLLKPQIKRLTTKQFQKSTEAAFGKIFKTSDFPVFGDGNPRIGFANDPNLLFVNEVNILPLYNSAKAIATTATANVLDIKQCASSFSPACLASLIDKYALVFWRRPATAEEKYDIQILMNDLNSGTSTQQIQFLLTHLLMSPNHLFRAELGIEDALERDIFTLTQYEVASLLSFSMWDSPPDSELLDLAMNNRLHDISELKLQVARMQKDVRFQEKMTDFSIDLLKIEDVLTTPKDASLALTSKERQDLYESAKRGLAASYASPTASLLTPFQKQKFYINQQTARFFNVPSSSVSTTLAPIDVSEQERYGIASHPAFLTAVGGIVESGIVKRGIFTLEQLLCFEMPPAPADVSGISNLPDGFDPSKETTRVVLQTTHTAQKSCLKCHAVIDPAGFAYENFNALGQFRTTEKENLSIDASGDLFITQPLQFKNSVDFFSALQQNPDFRSCLDKKFFQYVSGQGTEQKSGYCEAQNFENKINQKGTDLKNVFESLVELDSFLKRSGRGE